MDWLLLAQGLNLLGCNVYYLTLAFLSLPSLLLRYLGVRRAKGSQDPPGSATFYEGQVFHVRRAPAYNEFKYAVRMAVLDLDAPPSWFRAQAPDHMTADEARKFAGTKGPVKLLTDPISAGYTQNPISVYYCYGGEAAAGGGQAGGGRGASPRLECCIAEVTNTPWGERVTFVFSPDGQSVRKALHVSPFMDMDNTWHLEAPEPGERLRLVVRASHPVHGDYFHADLVARRSASNAVNEEAGLGSLLRYGFMPHRVALLIYWQAVKLAVKGVPFYPPPTKEYQRQLLAEENEKEQQGAAAEKEKDRREVQQPGGQGKAARGTGKAAVAAKVPSAVANGTVDGHGKGFAAAGAGMVAGGGGGRGGGLCPVAAWGAAQHTHPRNRLDGKHFVWRLAPGWPWRES